MQLLIKIFFSRAHPATLIGPVPDLGFADTTLYSIIKLDNIAPFAADLFLMQLQKHWMIAKGGSKLPLGCGVFPTKTISWVFVRNWLLSSVTIWVWVLSQLQFSKRVTISFFKVFSSSQFRFYSCKINYFQNFFWNFSFFLSLNKFIFLVFF